MSKSVTRGATRAAHYAKTEKHAQLTPFPPRCRACRGSGLAAARLCADCGGTGAPR
jgi:DnaJ-class molecular chaperone